MNLTPEELAIHTKLTTDLPYFAEKCLKVKDKEGEFVTFTLNSAQEIIHYEIERQLRECTWVRMIIIKGRQQGCSTYVAARFFWKAALGNGKTVMVLSHEKDSARALFEKADVYYQRAPREILPAIVTKNSLEMSWDNDSDYIVLTAGSKNTGRSRTGQLLHASEFAYYEDPSAINAGAMQTVSLVRGTEIIKETTGNGRNHAYIDVQNALAGRGNYRVVFVPWYVQTEYRMECPPDFKLDDDELRMRELYHRFQLPDGRWIPGLVDNEQFMWRRNKIADELKTERLFRQEYPCTLEEAFQASGENFYPADLVQHAVNCDIEARTGPLILGVDPARKGDRTVLALRRGSQVIELVKYEEMEQMRLAGIVASYIDKWDVDKCFIDWGMGHGTIDRLRERGYGHIVEGVHFGGASNEEIYLNKRVEMAFLFKEWLEDGAANLPNDKEMIFDIGMLPDFTLNSRSRICFPSKEDIKKNNQGKSPDILDAIMLTFAEPVYSKEAFELTRKSENTAKGSELTSIQRFKDGY